MKLTEVKGFYRECLFWKRTDPTLAITFKAVSMPKVIVQAVCEMRGEDHVSLDPSEDFYAECIELVKARDTTLRSNILHIMRQREGVNKNQLTFDFN